MLNRWECGILGQWNIIEAEKSFRNFTWTHPSDTGKYIEMAFKKVFHKTGSNGKEKNKSSGLENCISKLSELYAPRKKHK